MYENGMWRCMTKKGNLLWYFVLPQASDHSNSKVYRLVQKKGPALLSTSQAELSHNLATYLSLDPVDLWLE